MKPFVICHMMCTVDGRIVGDRWSPPAEGDMWSTYGRDYEFIHDQLVGDAWLVGRKTMTEFAKGEPWPGLSTAGIDRSNFIANTTARGYAIGVDPKGKLHYHTSVANGNHIVSVLTEQVEDEYLAELRASAVSYIFAGKTEVDLALALDILGRDFAINRLLLEGGGTINGAFLRAGLIDELSLLLAPAVDGLKGVASVFDYDGPPDDPTPKRLNVSLIDSEARPNGVMWLRYSIVKT
jgi:riboflavin biosynthesis pyrimidine reductase